MQFLDMLKGAICSKKFLLSLGTVVTLIAQEKWEEAASVVIGYVLGQGLADAGKALSFAPGVSHKGAHA